MRQFGLEPPVIIGIDVGTTAVKVVAFDAEGGHGIRAIAVRPCRLTQPEPGWQVVDAETLLSVVDEAVLLCVQQLDDAPVLGFSLSAAMHALVGLDEGQHPLTPVVTWADSRSAGISSWLHEEGHGSLLLRRTGTPVHSMSPLTKLLWFQRHDLELASRVRYWAGLKALLIHHLTGVLVEEYSSASASGMLNLETLDWDEVALEFAGVDAAAMPPVAAVTDRIPLRPEQAARLGLPEGIPVVLGGGDGPLGNLGTGAIVPGVVGLSLGTSGAVRMPMERPAFDSAGRLFCYALTEDLWTVGGPVSNGGIAFEWAARTFAAEMLSGNDPGQALEIAAMAPAGCDRLVMVPYLLAERAPLWDPELPGAFLGVRYQHRRQHFLRAAVEGVCLQVSSVVDIVEREIHPVQQVRGTGGPFRAQLWRTVMAAMIGKPFHVASDAGGTALGAAALGAYALGLADTLGDSLRLLGGAVAGDDPADRPVQVTDRDTEAYERLRSEIPALIASYERVADIFQPATRPGTGPDLVRGFRGPTLAP